jgi:hypothetical protein
MVITRKLKEVIQALDLITTKKDPMQPPNNTENAQELNSLVEGICNALVGYQVCTPKPLVHITPKNALGFIKTRHL